MNNKFLLCVIMLLLQHHVSFSWPVQLSHYYNKNLNAHIFLVHDAHLGTLNNRHDIDQQALIKAAKNLNAHVICEDIFIGLDAVPDKFKNSPLECHCGAEQVLMALLLADPVHFNKAISSRLDFFNKVISAFGYSHVHLRDSIMKMTRHRFKSYGVVKDIKSINLDVPPPPLQYLSLLCQAQNVPVTNVEFRFPLGASIADYPVPANKVFQVINNVIKTISAFDDGPILNEFYKQTVQDYEASYKQFQETFDTIFHSDESLFNALNKLPIATIKEIILHSSMGDKNFTRQFNINNEEEVNALIQKIKESSELDNPWVGKAMKLILFMKMLSYYGLIDCLLAHHIYISDHKVPTIVYAGAAHIVPVEQLLEKLGYSRVDLVGVPLHPRLGPLSHIDFDYYFSRYRCGLRILPTPEIMDQDHNCPILSKLNINEQDHNGMTMLMHAASRGHCKTAKYLLQIGAVTTLHDKNNKTAYELAQLNNQKEMLELFKEVGIKS